MKNKKETLTKLSGRKKLFYLPPTQTVSESTVKHEKDAAIFVLNAQIFGNTPVKNKTICKNDQFALRNFVEIHKHEKNR